MYLEKMCLPTLDNKSQQSKEAFTSNTPSDDIVLCWDETSSWMRDGGDSDSMGRNLPGELKCLVMIVGDPWDRWQRHWEASVVSGRRHGDAH